MKRVGIITICGNDNFGNKLQNYALLKKIDKFGFDARTIWIENSFESNSFKALLKKVKHVINDYIINYSRNKFFIYFTKENLKIYKKKLVFNDDLKKIEKDFSYFIVGSDQVWNYQMVGNFKTYFMLNVNSNKNISYAASIGTNEIPEYLNPTYISGFNNLKSISVREDRGKEIVEELTGRKDVEVLVDPTMLLTTEEWDKVSKKPKMLKTDKYILNYFLGELSEERKKEIQRVAQENNCEIINILDKNSPFYECGPSEFIYLEKNAFLICTDSFHSSVFAILYNRPFIVFDREQKNVANMNSRLETLLNKFKLENRKYKDKITKENLNHDYTEAYKILEKERIKADKFLRKALDIKDSD